MKLKYYLRGLGLGIVVTAIIMSIVSSKNRKMTDAEIIARAKQLGLIESTVLTNGIGEEYNPGSEAAEPQDAENADAGDNANAGEADAQSDTDGNGNTDEPDAQSDMNADGNGNDGNSNSSEPDTQAGTDSNADKPDIRTSANGNGNAAGPDAQAGADGNAAGPYTQAGADGNAAEPDIQADADTASPDNKTGTGSSVTASTFPKVLIINNGESSYTVSKKLKEIGAVESAEAFDTYLCENGYDKKIRAGTYTIPVDATNEQMAKIVTGAKTAE